MPANNLYFPECVARQKNLTFKIIFITVISTECYNVIEIGIKMYLNHTPIIGHCFVDCVLFDFICHSIIAEVVILEEEQEFCFK